jgi:uncharacterized protein YodC (DUF2158 family)
LSFPFKVGDVVELKSGGPPMTVAVVYEDHDWASADGQKMAECHWIASGLPQMAVFPIETLQAPGH